MHCTAIREAWSARLDQELSNISDDELDRHLLTCPACTRFAASTVALHRRVRVRAAEPVPDLTDAILSNVAPRPQPRPTAAPQPMRPARVRAAWARPALLMVALTQLAVAIPELVSSDNHGVAIHVAHEQGSWDIALALALLFVVWRPARAVGLLPFVTALVIVLAGTAVLDVSRGHAVAISEMHHLLNLAGIVFLWLLTPPNPTRPLRRGRTLVAHPRPAAW